MSSVLCLSSLETMELTQLLTTFLADEEGAHVIHSWPVRYKEESADTLKCNYILGNGRASTGAVSPILLPEFGIKETI